MGNRTPAGGDDPVGHLIGGPFGATAPVGATAKIIDDHGGASTGQRFAFLLADSPAAAGDDRDLSVELHRGSPCLPARQVRGKGSA